LKLAIQEQEKFPEAASLLKLLVGKPNEEKGDLDGLRKAFKEGQSFNFSKLIKDYEIDEENPISVELPAVPVIIQPPTTPAQPHPHRKQRWAELNKVLGRNKNKKKRLNSDDDSYSTAFSYSRWADVGPIFAADEKSYTESVQPIPDPDFEVLSKVLSWVLRSYKTLVFTEDNEAKRIHLIAPILWAVVQLLPDVKVNVEQDLDGDRVHAHGHFEFVLTRGNKRVCIVEAKKEQFEQGLAQNLLGCEVAADLDNIHEVFGIVTNFEKWIFLKSLDNEILIDEYNVLSFTNGFPDRTQLMLIVGKLHSLLL